MSLAHFVRDLSAHIAEIEGVAPTAYKLHERHGVFFASTMVGRHLYEANGPTAEAAFDALRAIVANTLFDVRHTRSVA